MDIRKNFFAERVVRHYNRPSLEVFKRHIEVVLSGGLVSVRSGVGLGDFGGLCQPRGFCDTVIL